MAELESLEMQRNILKKQMSRRIKMLIACIVFLVAGIVLILVGLYGNGGEICMTVGILSITLCGALAFNESRTLRKSKEKAIRDDKNEIKAEYINDLFSGKSNAYKKYQDNMAQDKSQTWLVYLFIYLLLSPVFIIGMLIGYFMMLGKYKKITKEISNLEN